MRGQSLRCVSLMKSFDGVRALSNVSLDLSASGSVAIIGPNGAGKTTLLNILTGIVKPEAGEAWFGDDSLVGRAPHYIARLGIARTFQELRLIENLSAMENIMLASSSQSREGLFHALFRFRLSKEEETAKAGAIDQLRCVGLADEANELAGELSYGQQKLLALACCLATGARVLLLDEPISGVDPQMAEKILDLLRGLRDRGTGIVFIEHDIDSVRRFADFVIVMDQGRVVAQGKPTEVLNRREIMEAYVG